MSAMLSAIRRLTAGTLLFHLCVAVFLGALVVVMPAGLILILPMIVVVGTIISLIRAQRQQESAVLVYVVVISVVIVTAHFAPVKTTERFLNRTMKLPNALMTLADLDEELSHYESRNWLPRNVRVTVNPACAADRIEFQSQETTVREFVDAIENQSALRHHFGHCGNGSNVLFGGDCSFGLHLR